MNTMKKILLLGLMLTGANVFAGHNKWVDAEGKVHYSDQAPPPDAKVKLLRVTPDAVAPVSSVAASSVAVSAPSASKTIAEREAELRKARIASKEAAEKAALEISRIEAEKANCATAQQNLRTLQDGMRLVEIDAKGERYYMDDEQRRLRIEKTRQDIKTYCK